VFLLVVSVCVSLVCVSPCLCLCVCIIVLLFSALTGFFPPLFSSVWSHHCCTGLQSWRCVQAGGRGRFKRVFVSGLSQGCPSRVPGVYVCVRACVCGYIFRFRGFSNVLIQAWPPVRNSSVDCEVLWLGKKEVCLPFETLFQRGCDDVDDSSSSSYWLVFFVSGSAVRNLSWKFLTILILNLWPYCCCRAGGLTSGICAAFSEQL
jgi:hypothetical protein